MGRPPAARGSRRGGESIPTFRALRVRLTVAAAAAALAAALAAYPMLEAGTLAPIVDALGGLALLFTAGAVFGRGGLAAAVFSLATEYVLVEVTGRAAATSVIVYAVGLILLCELVVWACDLRSAALVDRHIVLDQLLVLAVAALAAALLAVVALAATTVQLAEAFEAALLGTAAAVALLALPWLLLRNAGAG